MQLRVQAVDFFATRCRCRLPFRFGGRTMRSATLLHARVTVETEAGPAAGYAADLLVPRWFEKTPEQSPRRDVERLVESARAAGERATQLGTQRVFALWRALYAELVEALGEDPPGRLPAGFGVALVERGTIDAACRAAGLPFFDALREDLFAFDAGAVLPELAGWTPALSLPREPAGRLVVRHTVGGLDALREEDLAGGGPTDGMPRTLAEDVRRHGLTAFKIKLGGDPEADGARLADVARVLAAEVPGTPLVTLDGNEQCTDLEGLAAALEALAKDPDGARLVEGLRYVEQPLPREASFAPEHERGRRRLSELAPLLIDEADTGPRSFPRALAGGYRGVSAKSCKGVFRALVNRGLCELHEGAFQSGEDLTTLPVVALQSDLALMAALGVEHVERNGHHYFRGLDHLPAEEARAALLAHPDLYRAAGDGVELAIEDGRIGIGSLRCPGLGFAVTPDVGARTPLARWSAAEDEDGHEDGVA